MSCYSLTALAARQLDMLRQLHFPGVTLTLAGRSASDDRGLIDLITLADGWHVTEVFDPAQGANFLDFQIADRSTLGEDLMGRVETLVFRQAVSQPRRRYTPAGALQRPVGEPRVWKVRCQPLGQLLPD